MVITVIGRMLLAFSEWVTEMPGILWDTGQFHTVLLKWPTLFSYGKATAKHNFLHVYTKHFCIVLTSNEFSRIATITEIKRKSCLIQNLRRIVPNLITMSQTAVSLVVFEFPINRPAFTYLYLRLLHLWYRHTSEIITDHKSL